MKCASPSENTKAIIKKNTGAQTLYTCIPGYTIPPCAFDQRIAGIITWNSIPTQYQAVLRENKKYISK